MEEQQDSEDEIILEEIGTKRISYDKRIIPVLEDIKRAPKQELQSVILITGRVGVGKSKLAQDLAYYLDPTFDIDRIVWNSEDLITRALQLGPGSAIVFDEARESTDSTQALSEKNRRLGLFLDTVRSRCLFIILIQPSPWSFQMSFFTEASDCHFHVKKVRNDKYDRNDPESLPFERGWYDFYNFDKKKQLYISGKKWRVFKKSIKPSIPGCKFGSRWIVDKAEYQKRKDAAVALLNQEAEANKIKEEMGKETRVSALRLKYLKSLKTNMPSLRLETVANLLGEKKQVLLLSMDYECRKMYDV